MQTRLFRNHPSMLNVKSDELDKSIGNFRLFDLICTFDKFPETYLAPFSFFIYGMGPHLVLNYYLNF